MLILVPHPSPYNLFSIFHNSDCSILALRKAAIHTYLSEDLYHADNTDFFSQLN